jgi:hypothetical protein
MHPSSIVKEAYQGSVAAEPRSYRTKLPTCYGRHAVRSSPPQKPNPTKAKTKIAIVIVELVEHVNLSSTGLRFASKNNNH